MDERARSVTTASRGGALRGLGPEHVLYRGSISASLSTAVRLDSSEEACVEDVDHCAVGSSSPAERASWSGRSTATAPSRKAVVTALSPLGRRTQWLNTRLRMKTTITVAVIDEPKIT